MRLLRGIAALAALAALMLGIPAALMVFGGNPLPESLSWSSVSGALLRPASDRVLIGLITIAGWIVWAALLASVTAEIVNALPGRRRRHRQLHIPGLGIGQKLAAVLIVAVVSMIAVPHLPPAAMAEPTTPTPAASANTTTSSAVSAVDLGGPREAEAVDSTAERPETQTQPKHAVQRRDHQVHVVQRGEWLWTLAEQYLDDGSRWKEIAAANPGIDPDRLAVGQRLNIPVAPPHHPAVADQERVRPHDGDTVKVARGDSLSTISSDLYGTPKHWPELFEENRDAIADPDLINVGQKLELPGRAVRADTDHTVRHNHPTANTDNANRGADRTETGERDSTGAGDTADEKATAQSEHRTADSSSDRVGSAGADHGQRETTEAPNGRLPPSTASSEPSTATPTQQAPPNQTSKPSQPAATAGTDTAPAQLAASLSVGLLLAAGLITALSTRRRRQLHARQPGRRIPQPSSAAVDLERDIKSQHQLVQFEQLDQLTRGIAAHCRHTGADLPALLAARVADDRIDLMLAAAADHDPPAGIETAADGSVWTLPAAALDTVEAIPGIDEQPPPYPALVSLGRDADTAHVLLNLETAAELTVTAHDTETATAAIAAIALELALSPWAADLDLTFVGPLVPGLAESLDHPAVTHVDDVDRVLTGLEHRAALQRDHLTGDTVGQKRLDPEIADAWSPRVVLFGAQLTSEQATRLAHVVTELPRVAIAAVTTHQALTPWSLTLTDTMADLAPLGLQLTPQLVSPEQYDLLLDLISTTGTDKTDPAPWWDHDAEADDQAGALAAGATVTDLNSQRDTHTPAPELSTRAPHVDDTTAPPVAVRRPLNLHALIDADTLHRPPTASNDSEGAERPVDPDGWRQLTDPPAVDRPMLRILGQPDLTGTATSPARYKQRVNEVLLYLLEHPGCTLPRLMDNLHISRDYAKNVLGTLRKTLGADPAGHLYFPEMSKQRGYRLHEAVTCDYHYATRLVGRGVNTASSEALIKILSMVRGTPLFGAEDWAGVAELRADIPSKIADVAHELTTRALTEGNVGLARWATEKGRLANPDEETLLADQLRTEQQAGNRGDVVKLVARISDHAREHGRDLSDNTKEVLRRAVAM